MMNRKAQAALEFIMTYGWAILVVLVAVGALAYFGVLSPDRFLPNKCTLQSGIACLDFLVEDATGVVGPDQFGRVTLSLTNSLGYDLSLVSVDVGNCGDTSAAPISMSNGDRTQFVISCVAGQVITAGTSKFNQYVNLSYTVTDTGIAHHNIGQITARVE